MREYEALVEGNDVQEGPPGRSRSQAGSALLDPTSFTQFAAHVEKDAGGRLARHRPSGQNSAHGNWPRA